MVLAVILGCVTGVWIAPQPERRRRCPAYSGDVDLLRSREEPCRGDGLTVAGISRSGYGLVYPLVLSPIYALAGDGVRAFDWVKAVNALAMSATCIPTYVIARRVVPRGWALGPSVLAVTVPLMANARLVMTEALFYPAFLLCALLMIRALSSRRPCADSRSSPRSSF